MKLKPIGDHLIIKPPEKESVTESGIIIPDSKVKEKPELGEVVAVGECKYVSVGDTVLFNKYLPSEIEFEDETLLIAEEEDLLAIVKQN